MKMIKSMAVRTITAAIAIVIAFAACNKTKEDIVTPATISVEPTSLEFAWDQKSELSATVETTAQAFDANSAYSWIGVRTEESKVYVRMNSENTTGESRRGSVRVLALDKNGSVLNECSISVTQGFKEKDPSGEETQFADTAFVAYLLEYFDYNQDGVISESEAASVKSMDIDSYGVSSIDGIRMFSNLEELDLSNNSIETIDLSGLTKLKCLIFQNCNTEKLIVDGCTSLSSIIARKNQLKSIDF